MSQWAFPTARHHHRKNQHVTSWPPAPPSSLDMCQVGFGCLHHMLATAGPRCGLFRNPVGHMLTGNVHFPGHCLPGTPCSTHPANHIPPGTSCQAPLARFLPQGTCSQALLARPILPGTSRQAHPAKHPCQAHPAKYHLPCAHCQTVPAKHIMPGATRHAHRARHTLPGTACQTLPVKHSAWLGESFIGMCLSLPAVLFLGCAFRFPIASSYYFLFALRLPQAEFCAAGLRDGSLPSRGRIRFRPAVLGQCGA